MLFKNDHNFDNLLDRLQRVIALMLFFILNQTFDQNYFLKDLLDIC